MTTTSRRVVAPPLSHLFTALYRDGTSFTQPADDRPREPNADGGGSAFSDVDVPNVIAFTLESGTSEDDPAKHLYLVDLRDGHFEIDGVSFTLGPDDEPKWAERRLIYFRRVGQHHTSNIATGLEVGHVVTRSYHLGYEYGVGTKIVVRTIAVGHETIAIK